MAEINEEIDRKTYYRRRAGEIFIPKTFGQWGWYLMGVFLLLLLIGTIRSWFVPDAHFFDPIIAIMNAILWIFGKNLDTIDERYPYSTIAKSLASGAALSIKISIVSVVLGFFLAILLAVILVNKVENDFGLKFILKFILKFFAQLYVDFFRSVPLLVQILMIYFGMPRWVNQVIRVIDADFLTAEIFAGTLALMLNTAAYQAEILRGGIMAIPSGQTEASRALGMTAKQTMQHVILPQAVRIIVPPLTNELINVILNSSLLYAIGVRELTKTSQSLQSYYFLWYVFVIAALYYFVMTYSMAKITKRIEIKLKIPGLGVSND